MTGATLSKDYEVLNQVVLLNHPIYIRFIADQIALETNETLEIHLRPRSEAQLPEGLFCSTINLIIYDSDSKLTILLFNVIIIIIFRQ